MQTQHKCRGFIVLIAVLIGFLPSGGFSQIAGDLAGWERGSEYNQRYDVSEYDDFKGVVEEIVDITPLPGMAAGVGLMVKDQDGDLVEIQLGPKSFVKPDSIGLKKGDKIKVKGVWVTLGDKDVVMASKVKKGEDMELKVRRTKDGTPFWTLTPEELAKEAQE